MRKDRLLLILALSLGVAPLAAACELLPEPEQRKADRLELLHQKELVKDLASQADLIAIVKVTSVSSELDSANFSVIKAVKGNRYGDFSLALDQRIMIGCYPSAFFQSVRQLRAGETYLLYAKDGMALRAGSNERFPDEISLKEELRLIRAQLGPNKSFKPNPLRGSA